MTEKMTKREHRTWAAQYDLVPCGHCAKPITALRWQIVHRQKRSKDGRLFCNTHCKYLARRQPCDVCGQLATLLRGLCPMHYARARRNGDPMVKQRNGGIDDGAEVVGPEVRQKKVAPRTEQLEPAEVRVLLELEDGQPRSIGLLADVTHYSKNTVREAVYRIRRKFGEDVIEIVQYQPWMKFRLTKKIRPQYR